VSRPTEESGVAKKEGSLNFCPDGGIGRHASFRD